jgi:hypothetical protein
MNVLLLRSHNNRHWPTAVTAGTTLSQPPQERHNTMNRLGIFFIFLLFLFSAHLKAADETMKRVTIGVSGMMKSKTGIT